MNGFAALFAVAQRNLDAHYGELANLIPQKDGRVVAGGDDPNNPPRVGLMACFTDEPAVAQAKGSGANTHDNTDVLARRTQVDFDAALFTDGLPQKDWIVVATSQPRSPRYKIVSAEFDGVGRVVCRITFQGYSPS